MTISYLSDPITFKNHVQAESSEKCAHLFSVNGLSPFCFQLGFFLQEAISCGELSSCENKIKNPGNLCFALKWICYLLD